MKQKTKLVASAVFLILMTPLAVLSIMEKIGKLQEPEIVLGEEASMAVAENAIKQFFKFCPDAEENWQSIETANISYFPNGFTGSPPFVGFDLKFAQRDTKNIEKFEDETLAFVLRAGETPGLELVKIAGNPAKFCGLEKASARISEPAGRGVILIHGPVNF